MGVPSLPTCTPVLFSQVPLIHAPVAHIKIIEGATAKVYWVSNGCYEQTLIPMLYTLPKNAKLSSLDLSSLSRAAIARSTSTLVF
jgi:hypothetical protein